METTLPLRTDAIRAEWLECNRLLLAAGRGGERPSEIRRKADDISLRYVAASHCMENILLERLFCRAQA